MVHLYRSGSLSNFCPFSSSRQIELISMCQFFVWVSMVHMTKDFSYLDVLIPTIMAAFITGIALFGIRVFTSYRMRGLSVWLPLIASALSILRLLSTGGEAITVLPILATSLLFTVIYSTHWASSWANRLFSSNGTLYGFHRRLNLLNVTPRINIAMVVIVDSMECSCPIRR